MIPNVQWPVNLSQSTTRSGHQFSSGNNSPTVTRFPDPFLATGPSCLFSLSSEATAKTMYLDQEKQVQLSTRVIYSKFDIHYCSTTLLQNMTGKMSHCHTWMLLLFLMMYMWQKSRSLKCTGWDQEEEILVENDQMQSSLAQKMTNIHPLTAHITNPSLRINEFHQFRQSHIPPNNRLLSIWSIPMLDSL